MPWEDSVISKLVKKLRVTQIQTSLSPWGRGWVRAWKKLRERKNNYSGAEKGRGSHHDASNWGSNPALFFPAPEKTGNKKVAH